MKHQTNRVYFICLVLLVCSCSIMEEGTYEVTEQRLPTSPIFASSLDSTQVFKVKSTIQCSPVYLLSAYVIIKDGKYTLDITKEERIELGILERDYTAYLKRLSRIKPCQ